VTYTPAIREFLLRLDDLVDGHDWPQLDHDATGARPGHAAALARLPHRHDSARDIELEIDDRNVIVTYGPEHITFTKRDEALQFVEMLGDGRVALHVRRGVALMTLESYRDGLTRPFRRSRVPQPTLRPRTEVREFGFV